MRTSPAQPAAGQEFTGAFAYALTPGTVRLGAYVVEVRFDPARVTFVATDPSLAHSRVANVASISAGSIVIAGAAAEGFSDDVLYQGSFRARAAGVGPESFQVVLREAVDTTLDDLLD
ncbi:MAG: hypothetical protein H0V09_05300 [Gemmatimonadetes bacterium]|nr:hypothetical protein [Gemmatimonadota bacterium]